MQNTEQKQNTTNETTETTKRIKTLNHLINNSKHVAEHNKLEILKTKWTHKILQYGKNNKINETIGNSKMLKTLKRQKSKTLDTLWKPRTNKTINNLMHKTIKTSRHK